MLGRVGAGATPAGGVLLLETAPCWLAAGLLCLDREARAGARSLGAGPLGGEVSGMGGTAARAGARGLSGVAWYLLSGGPETKTALTARK